MFQSITILGYLGSDPDLRFMPNGNPVTTFPVAASKSYTDNNGQKVERTSWFRVSVFGPQAETCKTYLAKGRPVLVVGELKPDKETGGPRVWTDKDGNAKANFEVKASTVRFLPGGKSESAQQSEEYENDGTPF